MKKAKPFEISQKVVVEAWKQVKANQGAAGVDKQTIAEFEKNLKNNLYTIWNRMSSGSYVPRRSERYQYRRRQAASACSGFPLSPTEWPRSVWKRYLEPMVEPHFHEDSYGYRPGKSALDAVEVTRKRCWKYDWVLEFDIKGLFDNIDFELLMKTVRWHTKERWLLLYVERWLKAPFQKDDGTLVEKNERDAPGRSRKSGPGQSLSSLCVRSLDEADYPLLPFCRYADDGIVQCRTYESEAQSLKKALEERCKECKLELHPVKTRIVYCKNSNRRKDYPAVSFDFLGFTFRPRMARSRAGKVLH